MIENSIGKIAYYFNSHRMMHGYVTEAYIYGLGGARVHVEGHASVKYVYFYLLTTFSTPIRKVKKRELSMFYSNQN